MTEILVQRIAYTQKSTTGLLVVDGNHFGVTLEDRIRPKGVKVYGETCIPAGRYRLDWRVSPKFRRRMIWLQDVEGFETVYIHGGNKAADTLGCILAARERTTWDFILGSLEQKLFDYLTAQAWVDCWVTVRDWERGPGYKEMVSHG